MICCRFTSQCMERHRTWRRDNYVGDNRETSVL